jgi:beta-xylosidase
MVRGQREQRRRHTRLVTILVPAIALWLVAAHTANASPRVHGAVLAADAPDPDIVMDGSQFLAFTTNTGVGNVPVWRSSDLGSWSFVHDALPLVGGWAVPGATWSPTVVRAGTLRWVMFYTAVDRASGRQCIGRAVASRPTETFHDDNPGPVVCQLDHGGSIDPDVAVDPANGAFWLAWKTDDPAIGGWGEIWSGQLDSTVSHFVSAPHALIGVDREDEGVQVEAPQLVGANGQYWLFYSANAWDTPDYHVGAALCFSPAGPSNKLPATWLDRSSGVDGPGSVSVLTDAAGQMFVAFHGWVNAVGYAEGGVRGLFVERITFAPNVVDLRPDLPRRATPALLPNA